MQDRRTYLAIDLKSFYASVECVERGLDPMTARLVVADPTRTEKTICLAASPGIKALGVPNRCRVFQIPKNLEYIMAPPRMKLYLDYSARIYGIYLNYFAAEDIHVYSVDEAFMDATHYLALYQCSARELAERILQDIRTTYGLYATCGIGTNLYLAKIALDILAKHSPEFIGELDEAGYRKRLWDHRPLTDFWMIGKGTVRRLERIGIRSMREIAMADEHLLFRIFGINAELLMDHAWGLESVTIEDIKHYQTKTESISSGQVLPRDYNYTECRLIVKEMCDLLCLKLVKKQKMTSHVTLYLNTGRNPQISGNLSGNPFPDSPDRNPFSDRLSRSLFCKGLPGNPHGGSAPGASIYEGMSGDSMASITVADSMGSLPRQQGWVLGMRGSETLTVATSSNRLLGSAVLRIYDRIAREGLYYRRVTISFDQLISGEFQQLDLFTDLRQMQKDQALQQAALSIKEKFGKNAILKGMNLEEAGTAIERNQQIGGHKS